MYERKKKKLLFVIKEPKVKARLCAKALVNSNVCKPLFGGSENPWKLHKFVYWTHYLAQLRSRDLDLVERIPVITCPRLRQLKTKTKDTIRMLCDSINNRYLWFQSFSIKITPEKIATSWESNVPCFNLYQCSVFKSAFKWLDCSMTVTWKVLK